MKITVITVSFNSAETIADTIESVLHQSFREFEYLVVDGGSTDGTLDIIRKYEPLFNGRLRWISEPDEGIYDAMNKGIAMATGDVVGFLNSDDFYSGSDILQLVSDSFEGDNDIDAIYGDVHYVRTDNLSKCVRYYSSRRFKRKWMRLGFMPAHPSFYCRKTMYEHFKFNTSYRIAADFELLLRMIFISRIKTQYVEKDFVTMRVGGASSSGLSSHRLIDREQLRALKENGVHSNILLLWLRYFYKIGELYITIPHQFQERRMDI